MLGSKTTETDLQSVLDDTMALVLAKVGDHTDTTVVLLHSRVIHALLLREVAHGFVLHIAGGRRHESPHNGEAQGLRTMRK